MHQQLQRLARVTRWLALSLVLFVGTARAQLLTEDFTYSGALTANGWTVASGGTTNVINASGANLTYAGLTTSGNSAALTNNGQDVSRTFTPATTGAIYASCLINVSAAQATGDYVIHFTSLSSSFNSRVFVKSVTGSIQFGISKSGNATVYASGIYALNTTYLLVFKYAYNGASTTDDVASLFINPAVGGTEPAASATEATGNDASSLGAINLRQGTAANAPTLLVDYIRVGTAWATVTSGAAVGGPTLSAAPTALTGYNTPQGTASSEQSFVLTASNLTTGITVTPSANVEISQTSGSGFSSSPINLASTTTSATIYARIGGSAPAGAFSGSIGAVSGTASANVSVAGTVTGPAGAATLISQIQGSGTTAALTGTQTIEAIVTRKFVGLRTFVLQEEDADSDNNPATSEGIMVYDPSGFFTGNQGDKVRVTGVVSEFTSSAKGNNSSLTQITLASAAGLTTVGTGFALPTITNVQLPVTNVSDLERYEGMLVNMSAASGNLTVTEFFELGRFGQVLLAALGTGNQAGTDARLDQYTQFNAPGVSGYAAYLTDNDRRSIYLDDANSAQNPDPIIHARGGNPLSAANTLRGGDNVASITAVLDERSEGYKLQTTTGVNFQAANPRPTTPPAVGGSLKVASFNVLNYFNDVGSSLTTFTNCSGGSLTLRGAENAQEFTRQRDKTIQAILNSGVDVMGLNEMQNNGFGSGSAIQNLINGLNAIAGPNTYTFVNSGCISTDAITVAIIYKPAQVTPVGASAAIPASFGTGAFGAVGRRALAQTFQQTSTGGVFTLVANHWKSKGSSSGGVGDADANDGQALSNGTRTRQAQDLVAWLATQPTGTTDSDYLVVGDLNAYAQENPLTTLYTAGYVNLVPNTTYSYVFDGNYGALDHGLRSASLASQVTGADKWHINSDEPNVLDYNTNFKTAGQISSLYAPDQFRTSDHDPVIIGLNLTSPPTPVTYLNFGAKYQNGQVAVSWATATERDNAYFEVERSADAVSYAAVGRVAGKGFSDSRQQYGFSDEQPLPGTSYYRLRQVDTDGTFALSRPVSVLNEGLGGATLRLFPNPASGEITLQTGAALTSVGVSNMVGQSFTLPVSDNVLNVSGLPTGLYLIEVQTPDGRTLRQRFVKE